MTYLAYLTYLIYLIYLIYLTYLDGFANPHQPNRPADIRNLEVRLRVVEVDKSSKLQVFFFNDIYWKSALYDTYFSTDVTNPTKDAGKITVHHVLHMFRKTECLI